MRPSSKTHLKSYLLLSILILQICHSDSYIAGDQQIKDLDTEDLRFVTDAQAWTSSPLWSATTTLYSTCGTKYLIGGYGVLKGLGRSGSNVNMLWVSRTYTDLPTHTGIMFSFLFAMVDSWDVGDLISFQFDNVSFNGWNVASPSTGPPNLCGMWYGDLFIQVSGTLVHSDSSLTFTIYASNDESTMNESFGVRDITLQFFTGTSSFTNQLCGKATQNIPVGSVCPCPDGKYLAPAPSNVCTPCDPSCALCYGGSNTECYKCKSGYSFYQDGCFACHTSCATCNGNDANQCTSCMTGYALTILNTCVALNDCFPLALDTFDATCTSPCPANTVLDWQGNCLSSCTSPRTKTQFGVFVCDFPCTTTQYLYWTGVCQNSCPSYYQTVQFKSRNLCNPNCPLNQFYLVAQKQCVNICPEGFFANTDTLLCQACGMSLCSQCLSTSPQNCEVCKQGTIKDADGICKTCQAMTVDYVKGITKGFQYRVRLSPSDCDLDVSIVQTYLQGEEPSLELFPPFTFDISKVKSNVYQVNINFDASFVEANNLDISLQHLEGIMPILKKFVPSPALEELAKSLPTAQKTIASVMGASFIGTLGIGALVLLWSLLNFQQFISIFMFINVDYPFQVQMFFSMFEDISWNILPNPLAYLTDTWSEDVLKLDNDVMKEYLPPARFQDHNITSFFIQNGGVMIFTNGLLLIILVVPLLLMKISYFRKNKVLRYIKAKLRWNVIARTFLENGVPLALATFLQLRIMMFDRTYLIICSIFAALSASYLIMLSVFLTQVVRDRPHDVLKKEVIRNIYGTLYEGIEMEKMGGKFYHLLILYRGVLLAALVVFSEKYPLMQTTIPIYYGFGLLYYIFNFVTFENKKLSIINRIKEILLLTCLISVLFLQFNVNSLEYYEILGWFIVACLSIAFLLEMGYVIISQIFNIKPLSLQLYSFLKKVYDWLAKKCSKDKRIRKRVLRPSRSRILD